MKRQNENTEAIVYAYDCGEPMRQPARCREIAAT